MLDESEKRGIGSLRPHSSLARGELMNFVIQNELTFGSDVPKKCDVKVYANRTVLELRIAIAKKIKTSWDTVKLKL